MLWVICVIVQGDQKGSVHLTITVQSSDAQRLFDHPVVLIVFPLLLSILIFMYVL